MIKRSVAVVTASLTTALVLSACGAQPANLPTSTPVSATPTPSTAGSASTPGATPAPAGGAAATQTGSPNGDRSFAQLPPQQRTTIGSAPPPLTIDPAQKYIATIKTSKGDIVVELNPEAAPQTVNNFVYLAQNGFYDGLTFHRVEPDFVIQGGDPLGTGTGGPGYNIPPEIKLQHVDGAIAMARQGGDPATTPNSGSQFYITMGAQPNLDNAYTVFGVTLSGQDVVRKIQVGDVIERIDIAAADGSAIAAAPPQPTAIPAPTDVPKPAACASYPLNVNAQDRIRGNPQAAATLIEYADFQCPECALFNTAFMTTFATLSNTVRLIYRYFPLGANDKALVTARAAEAAGLQGKFWEMHDLLYDKQKEWSSRPVAEISATLKTYAEQLQLDAAKFEQDLSSEAVAARVQRDLESGAAANVGQTPTLFLDGREAPVIAFQQPDTLQQLKNYADQRAQANAGVSASAKTFEFTQPEQVTNKDAKYVMTVKTSKGDIVAELDPALAPVNVNSTVFLAQQSYFDNTPVLSNETDLGAVLFSNPTPVGNPGYLCDVELGSSNFDKPGVLALYRTSQTQNSPQFIMTYSPTTQLDGQYTVIGQIVSGLDVIKTLTATVGTTQGDTITSVTVEEKK